MCVNCENIRTAMEEGGILALVSMLSMSQSSVRLLEAACEELQKLCVDQETRKAAGN